MKYLLNDQQVDYLKNNTSLIEHFKLSNYIDSQNYLIKPNEHILICLSNRDDFTDDLFNFFKPFLEQEIFYKYTNQYFYYFQNLISTLKITDNIFKFFIDFSKKLEKKDKQLFLNLFFTSLNYSQINLNEKNLILIVDYITPKLSNSFFKFIQCYYKNFKSGKIPYYHFIGKKLLDKQFFELLMDISALDVESASLINLKNIAKTYQEKDLISSKINNISNNNFSEKNNKI